MNWSVSPKRSTAISDLGYRIVWCEHPGQKRLWFTVYTPPGKDHPSGRCIWAGMDKEAAKQACEQHASKHQAIT